MIGGKKKHIIFIKGIVILLVLPALAFTIALYDGPTWDGMLDGSVPRWAVGAFGAELYLFLIIVCNSIEYVYNWIRKKKVES